MTHSTQAPVPTPVPPPGSALDDALRQYWQDAEPADDGFSLRVMAALAPLGVSPGSAGGRAASGGRGGRPPASPPAARPSWRAATYRWTGRTSSRCWC